MKARSSRVSWSTFPRSLPPTARFRDIVAAFDEVIEKIGSDKNTHSSNVVLAHVAPGLARLGFKVEAGKKHDEKISVPVLFGENGEAAKSFEADALHADERIVLEVEAGRGVANNQFLKDLFQACAMQDVDWFVVAVRNTYKTSKDYESVVRFFDVLFASRRLQLPLKGILVIGY